MAHQRSHHQPAQCRLQSLLLNSEPRTAQLLCTPIATIDISAFILISAPWRALREALLRAYCMTQAMIFSECVGLVFSCIMEIEMPHWASLLQRVIIHRNQSKSAMNVTYTKHLNASQKEAFKSEKKKKKQHKPQIS